MKISGMAAARIVVSGVFFAAGAGSRAFGAEPAPPGDLPAQFIALAAKAKATGNTISERKRNEQLALAAKAIVGKRLDELKEQFAQDATRAALTRPGDEVDILTPPDQMPVEVKPNGDFTITLRMIVRYWGGETLKQEKFPSKCYDTYAERWTKSVKIVARSGNLMTGRYQDVVVKTESEGPEPKDNAIWNTERFGCAAR